MFKRKLKIEKPKSRVLEMWGPLAESFAALEKEQLAEAQARARRNAPPPAPPRVQRTGDPLIDEAISINELLKDDYKIPARVPYKRRPDSIQLTPRHRLFRLEQTKAYRLDDLIARLGDMGRDIKSGSRRDLGPDVTVSIVPTQPPWLQVTRPDPVDHLWSDREKDLGPMTATVGDWWRGPEKVPALIQMFGKEAKHKNGLFCGQPGAGKSSALRRALLSLMENNSPSKLHIHIVEPKGDSSYGDFAGLPHVKSIATDIDGALQTLKQFDDWCNATGQPSDGIYRLLVFDEFQEAVEDEDYGKKVYGLIKGIMAKGRSIGIRVWIATQIPDKASFPPKLKGLSQFSVIGRIDSDGYIRSQLGVHGVSGLEETFEFMFVSNNAPTVITAHRLPDEQFANELDRLRGKYPVGIGMGISGQPVGIGMGMTGQRLGIGGQRSDISGQIPGDRVGTRSATRVMDSFSDKFPLGYYRSLDDEEREYVRELDRSGKSRNWIAEHIFGSKGGERLPELTRILGEVKRNGTKTTKRT